MILQLILKAKAVNATPSWFKCDFPQCSGKAVSHSCTKGTGKAKSIYPTPALLEPTEKHSDERQDSPPVLTGSSGALRTSIQKLCKLDIIRVEISV